jgi:signal transduction histidine kinase
MRNIFSKAIAFVKENPRILYSLVLVVFIPAAFFLNTYLVNSSYEKNIDKITQRKAVLAEDIINILLKDKFTDNSALQTSVDQIMQNKDEVMSLSIMKPQAELNSFQIIASSNSALINQKQAGDIQEILAWSKPEGVAFLDRNEQGRFWNVTKSLSDSSGEKTALVSIAFSLGDSDTLISKTIRNSYWFLIATLIVVILLVSNQARLFGYALTLTKLKEIDKMKDMFISMASHELRSPLTAIKGYVEFLKEKKEIIADKESQHYIENVSLSVDRLQDLVNDVLEVSRIEGNNLPVEITSVNPKEIISQTIEELKAHAIQKGISLSYIPQENSVLIKADPNRLKQVLVNLISNSIKYTEKGSVEVSTNFKDNYYLITIADTGIGISAEDQTKIFQKFNRIQNEKTKGIIGTGLGLWITQELIKRMKGKIMVESIEGVGSHFTICLPLEKK